MTGERLGQAGWLNPSKAGLRGSAVEAGFTSSSGKVRALLVNAKKGLSDEGRTRNRSESNQVAQEGFESERIAVTRGRRLLL